MSCPSRPWCAVALTAALALLPTASYAVERPHARDERVAHAGPVRVSTPLPTSGLPTGAAPTIPYAFASQPQSGAGDWQLVRPDGTTLELPRLTWSAWAPVGDGAIGMAGTEAGPELQRVSGAGTVRSRMVQHFGLKVSPDHEIVAWLGDRGRPQVVEAGDARHLSLPRVRRGAGLDAIRGERTCQEQAPGGGGCTAYVHRTRHVWVTTSHGLAGRVGPLRRVTDVNQRGRVIGLVSRRSADRPACWGVFRPSSRGGHRVFRTCDYYLDAFSPDGHRVLAERSTTRWWSVRRFAVLGRDGHLVHAWTFDAGRHRSLTQLTWEDSHHLLGVLMARGRWGLVRIGTDGSVEYAGPTVPVTDEELTPFSLPVR
jgi:hypothetical protein